jgi:hypothetical protein
MNHTANIIASSCALRGADHRVPAVPLSGKD